MLFKKCIQNFEVFMKTPWRKALTSTSARIDVK